MHILLVDDDAALSEMLREYLAGEGIATTPAFNGLDGVAAALSGQYDAVILDVMLPGIDGNEVLRRIRFQPRLEILDEVVAGLLWMQLDLPGDVDRDEMQGLANRLVSRIRAGAGETAIATEIAELQSGRFCRPANLPVIRDLTRRSIEAVRGA